MKRYAIGIDFGTLSARGVLVDISTGEEVAVSVCGYHDLLIETHMPNDDSVLLPKDYALANPDDYKEALVSVLKDLRKKADVLPEQIISIGADFTVCTMLPLDENLMPLCTDPRFRSNPHSWIKLWKHHGASEQAARIDQLANQRNEPFIRRHGGKSSSEWFFAKILETLDCAPEVFDATYRFAEVGDWVVYLLSGNLCHNSCAAGYKAFWDKDDGYPSNEFFSALHPRLDGIVGTKVGEKISPVGSRAGHLTEEMSRLTGLSTQTSVCVAHGDAHVSMPAAGIYEENVLLMNMGTSLCHMLISKQKVALSGICGCVQDGILPGFYGYEAGQSAVGDIFEWFVNNLVPYRYIEEMKRRNINVYDLIAEKMEKVPIGCNGIVALDWLNGNRSILNDSGLTGLVVGLTLTTKPEEIYRAMVEATAFGTRKIIQHFEEHGLSISAIYACGGISRKSQVIMQIFADVIGREIRVSNIAQTAAFGSAMFGTVAAGKDRGGFDSIFEAIHAMTKAPTKVFTPNMSNHAEYEHNYDIYMCLYDHFGLERRDIMYSLKQSASQQACE